MRWGIGQRTAAGIVLLVLAVAAGFGGLVIAIARLQRTNDRAQHAENVIVAAGAFERLVLDVQTGQRGFLLTRNPVFLAPALRAVRELPAGEAGLRRLVASDPVLRRRADALAAHIDRYGRYSAQVIALARADPARAARTVAAGEGNRLVDAIRTGLARLTASEDSLLAARRRSAASTASRAYWLAGVAAAVVLLIVLLHAWLLRRAVVQPVRALARSARRLGRGELGARAEVTAVGEVAELASAFNEMAESLHTEQEQIETLYRFVERISAETDVEELAIAALDQLAELTRTDLGVMYVASGDELWIAAERGLPEGAVSPFVSAELATLGHPEELRLPLRHGDHLVGCVVLARGDGEPVDAEAAAAAESLAGPVAVAVANDLAYRAARRAADINQIVLDATRDGIVMLDPAGRRLLVNTAYERYMQELGVPSDAPLAERMAAFAAATTDPERFVSAMSGLVTDPETEAVTSFGAAASGRSFRLYSTPAREAGRFVGRVYVLREVTAEREADRLKSELLATVSHELRTPLAGILGFAELLQRRELDVATRNAYLDTVHREALRLTRLINDFLDLQRIEEGALNLAFEPVHLRDVVAAQMAIHDREPGEHELELVAQGEPTEVLADPARLAQVVGNLLSNAIKYSPGGGAVRVAVERAGEAVRVSVADQGIGIPSGQQPRIFEKFFRVDSSDTREIGGTGLGLALCREVVEAHGGRIGFESQSGKGSTFWFELPALGVAAGDGRTRILVVERESSRLAEYLEDDGFRVDTAESGPDALRRAAADPPALVCLDVGLTGPLDGWELLARLKARPETASTPVVVCTGSNDSRRAAALGAADVLAKPFSRLELLAAVRRLLPTSSGRVLVVDDEETVRALVSETLRGAGFETAEARDGAEALAEVGRRRPDAVVLDLVMPNVDGFSVLDRLQADPEQRSIPVVVLTARELSADERALLRSRAVSLLEKSDYSADELRRLVRQALGSII